MIEFGPGVSFEFGTFLYTIVIFGLLLYLVTKLGFKPAMGILERRQQNIANAIEEAERNRQESLKLLEEQKQLLQQAREEASLIVERARQQSQKEAESIIQEAREQAERILSDAKADIEQQKNKAIQELRDNVATLSVLLASRIIEKEVDAQQQQETIEQFLSQVGDSL